MEQNNEILPAQRLCRNGEVDDNQHIELISEDNQQSGDVVPNGNELGVPNITEEKKYHLFFSYSTEDEPWVHGMVDKLEQEFGLKCLYPRRDFTPGEQLSRSINEGIEMSMKMVIVLSPDYLQSGWCDHERQIAFLKSVAERLYCVIPIMLRPCEPPDTLKTLGYIDVSRDANVEEKIIHSLNEKINTGDVLPMYVSEYEDMNGQCVDVIAKQTQEPQPPGRRRLQFPSILTNHHKQLFKRKGLRVQEGMYGELIGKVQSSIALKDRDYLKLGLRHRSCAVYFSNWILFILISFGIIVWCWLMKTLMEFPMIIILIIVILVLSPYVDPLFRFFVLLVPTGLDSRNSKLSAQSIYMERQIGMICGTDLAQITQCTNAVNNEAICVANWRVHSEVKNFSLSHLQEVGGLVYYDNTHGLVPHLKFVRFNTRACQKFLCQQCDEEITANLSECSKNQVLNKAAENLIETVTDKWYPRFQCWTDLPDTTRTRHECDSGKKCLCELIEDECGLECINPHVQEELRNLPRDIEMV